MDISRTPGTTVTDIRDLLVYTCGDAIAKDPHAHVILTAIAYEISKLHRRIEDLQVQQEKPHPNPETAYNMACVRAAEEYQAATENAFAAYHDAMNEAEAAWDRAKGRT